MQKEKASISEETAYILQQSPLEDSTERAIQLIEADEGREVISKLNEFE